MPTITLESPTAGTEVQAGLHATNYQDIQTVINGQLDNFNISTTADLDANARVGVRKNSTGSTFERRRINLIEGAGVVLTLVDDAAGEEVDVTIAATALTTYRKNTAKAVTNTTTETDLLNGEITIGAGVMGTTKVARLVAWGDMINDSGAARAFPQFKLKLGGTTLLDTGAGAVQMAASVTRYQWKIEAEIENLNSASSQISALNFESIPAVNASAASAFATGGGVYNMIISSAGFGHVKAAGNNTTAVDTTGAVALVLSVINGTATATYETKLFGAIIEVL